MRQELCKQQFEKECTFHPSLVSKPMQPEHMKDSLFYTPDQSAEREYGQDFHSRNMEWR